MSKLSIETIMEDERPIESIWWNDDDGTHCEVGRGGITAIQAYGENGHMAVVPWLAVMKGNEISHRVPAHQVEIVYFADGEAP